VWGYFIESIPSAIPDTLSQWGLIFIWGYSPGGLGAEVSHALKQFADNVYTDFDRRNYQNLNISAQFNS